MHAPTIAIIDDPSTEHGRTMARIAAMTPGAPAILWIVPDLTLPLAIALAPPVAALAVPLAIAGGTPDDLFTRRVVHALRIRAQQGALAFVAAGDRVPNPLGAGGITVSPPGGRGAWQVGLRSWGCSGACVFAAAVWACRAPGAFPLALAFASPPASSGRAAAHRVAS
jgi:hypothetical protein